MRCRRASGSSNKPYGSQKKCRCGHQNREDVDGTTAANEKAAAEAEAAAAEAAAAEEAAVSRKYNDYMDEEAPNEAEIQAYNCKVHQPEKVVR